jgi:hypothetical protein
MQCLSVWSRQTPPAAAVGYLRSSLRLLVDLLRLSPPLLEQRDIEQQLQNQQQVSASEASMLRAVLGVAAAVLDGAALADAETADRVCAVVSEALARALAQPPPSSSSSSSSLPSSSWTTSVQAIVSAATSPLLAKTVSLLQSAAEQATDKSLGSSKSSSSSSGISFSGGGGRSSGGWSAHTSALVGHRARWACAAVSCCGVVQTLLLLASEGRPVSAAFADGLRRALALLLAHDWAEVCVCCASSYLFRVCLGLGLCVCVCVCLCVCVRACVRACVCVCACVRGVYARACVCLCVALEQGERVGVAWCASCAGLLDEQLMHPCLKRRTKRHNSSSCPLPGLFVHAPTPPCNPSCLW